MEEQKKPDAEIQSAKEIVVNTVILYFRNLPKLLIAEGVLGVAFVLGFLYMSWGRISLFWGFGIRNHYLIYLEGYLLLFIYFHLFAYTATMLIYYVNETAGGRRLSIRDIYGSGNPRLSRKVTIRLFLLVVIIVPIEYVINIALDIAGFDGGIISLGDIILLIVPAILVQLLPMWVLEDKGLVKSLISLINIPRLIVARNAIIILIFMALNSVSPVCVVKFMDYSVDAFFLASSALSLVLAPLIAIAIVLTYRDSLARNSAGQRMDEAETM